MFEEKWLGKISRAKFGYGGRDDAQFGVWFTLSGTYGVDDGRGQWADWSKGCKWTKDERREEWGKIVEYVLGLMNDAKVKEFEDLVGIPVEVTSENNSLKSWRILREVL